MAKSIKKQLENSNITTFVFFAIFASFFTYSCMYAFRKPFSVATFEDMAFLGVHYKIWLITSQVIGYTLSKFIGIKLVSERKPKKRAAAILVVIGMAQLALLLFALTPRPYNIIWMFFNGLPLGVVWGLVFSYLEGRRTTELLGAGISVSFIFSSGFVKSVGKYLMLNFEISEFWMPFATGLIFAIPLLISVWLLDQLPPPDEKDIQHRTARVPMSKEERLRFLRNFTPAIVSFTVVYIFLTILRDIRDNFAAEIWISLGKGDTPSIFTTAEIPVGIGVLMVISLMILIKNNLKALNASIALIIIGLAVSILSTAAFKANLIGSVFWMIAVGFGLYLGYIAFHALLFERFIAAFKYVSNIGFLFYVADAFGYLGSVSSFLLKNFFSPNLSWLNFFSTLTYSLSLTGITLCVLTYALIRVKHRKMFPAEYALIFNGKQ
jgi:MFS family permease